MKETEVKEVYRRPREEAFSGNVKRRILTTLVSSQTMDDESLSTFMCMAEGTINSRPLTTVSDDPADAEPLTPAHLLLLRAGPVLPPGTFKPEDQYSRRR